MGLEQRDHELLALWAADRAGRVLPYFEEEYPNDDRPRETVESRARVGAGKSRRARRAAAVAAHTTDTGQAAARAAARAVGQAAATAHVATHAAVAANYALTATKAATVTDPTSAAAEERDRQYRSLPEHLRPVAFPDRDY